jgi:hypothetical protein
MRVSTGLEAGVLRFWELFSARNLSCMSAAIVMRGEVVVLFAGRTRLRVSLV